MPSAGSGQTLGADEPGRHIERRGALGTDAAIELAMSVLGDAR
jgi:hypothetical protein